MTLIAARFYGPAFAWGPKNPKYPAPRPFGLVFGLSMKALVSGFRKTKRT
jgi:hypothetical protein